MQRPDEPKYLVPYMRAAQRYGGDFRALLWASLRTQAARFEAFCRLADFHGATVADIGCGRADFLDHLLARGIRPAHYVGLEAVDAIAQAAEDKRHPDCQIVRADFVRQPLRMFVGADVVVFSGSLNTLAPSDFYATLRQAFQAATHKLIFNFLDSPQLAGQMYLHWHDPSDVLLFARSLTHEVRLLDDYLDGDCTLCLAHPDPT
jgi:SAM-dependent methyltransferase